MNINQMLREEMKVSGYTFKMLNFLIQDENDFENFFYNYYTDHGRAFFEMAAYRQDKIEQMNVQQSEFEAMFQENKKEALEQLFQHPVESSDVEFLNKKIEENKITVEELFKLHKGNPEYRLMSHLLQ
ncbi:hypothetical protein [Bacillus taeanensis]|uniref:Uncharacterized protein n=1 Tax=Bacillus taeanensis TaxID=273032 RepID=A0A366XXH1_9BACI|nr:hypothetical protein [Bacillus taeanensis]RBW69479.1 hypothetical protein DS031_11180 [Bacillus taeanensis]